MGFLHFWRLSLANHLFIYIVKSNFFLCRYFHEFDAVYAERPATEPHFKLDLMVDEEGMLYSVCETKQNAVFDKTANHCPKLNCPSHNQVSQFGLQTWKNLLARVKYCCIYGIYSKQYLNTATSVNNCCIK